jgi:hypothetical protein
MEYRHLPTGSKVGKIRSSHAGNSFAASSDSDADSFDSSIVTRIRGVGAFISAAIDPEQTDCQRRLLPSVAPASYRRLTGERAEARLRVSKHYKGSLEETAMGTYPPPGPDSIGRRIEEAVELIEMELRHTVAYVNDAVIPQVRKESISALRTVSEKLREMADHFEKSKDAGH